MFAEWQGSENKTPFEAFGLGEDFNLNDRRNFLKRAFLKALFLKSDY